MCECKMEYSYFSISSFRAAEKKASNLSYTCSLLRRAVRSVAAPTYEYRTPFEHYGTPPHYIAQRIINAANELNVMDARNTSRNHLAKK